jgi:hypothetical protein
MHIVATDLPGPLICERHTLHGIMSGMVETQAVGLLSIKTGDATETVECWATTKKLSLAFTRELLCSSPNHLALHPYASRESSMSDS